MGSAEPYRIELFDDEIESIRTFDPETQRSEQKVEKVDLLPAREFPLTENAVKAFRNTLRERFPIDPRRCPLYQDIKEGVTPAGIEYYLPLFFDHTDTLFDYLADNALFVLGEGALDAAEQFWTQAPNATSSAHTISNGRSCRSPSCICRHSNCANGSTCACASRSSREPRARGRSARNRPRAADQSQRRGARRTLKRFLAAYPGRVLITADSAGRREALIELAAVDLQPRSVEGWPAFGSASARPNKGRLRHHRAPARKRLRADRTRADRPHRARADRRARAASATASASGRAIPKRSSAISPSSRSAHRSCTSITASAAIRACYSMDIGGRAANSSPSNTRRATSSTCPSRNCISSAATPAPRPSSRRCIRSAAMHGSARRKRPRRKCATSPPSCSRSTRSAKRAEASRCLSIARWRNSSAPFPFEETPDQEQAIDAVIADLASPQADGPRRLRRRRLRQDRSRVARGVRRGDGRQAGRGARADDAARAAALPEFPRPLRRLAGARRRAVALQVEKGNRRGAEETRRRPDRRGDRHAQAAAVRREVQGSRPRHRRRGTALRRAPEGAAEEAARRSRPAHADRDADSAHAQHGDGGPARPFDHRDAAGASARRARHSSACTIPR